MENVCPLIEENLSSAAKELWKINQPNLQIIVRPLEWGIREHTLKIFNELESRSPTHIVCSDLVSVPGNPGKNGHANSFSFRFCFLAKIYFPQLLGPLLRTLIHLTSLPPSSPQPSIIISYRIRSLPKEVPFWSAFGLWFSYEPVLYRRYHQPSNREGPDYESDPPPFEVHSNEDPEIEWARYNASSSTYIFLARRKGVSLGWNVPDDDSDLLEGVGANGNQRQKGDDTFELMLLMDMTDGGD